MEFAVRTGIRHYLLSFTGAGVVVARRNNKSISHFKSRLLLQWIQKLQYASAIKEKPTLRWEKLQQITVNGTAVVA